MCHKGKMLFASFILGFFVVVGTWYAFASDAPETIELNYLENIYEPVGFDHAMHTDLAACATCHHHVMGMAATDPRCISCHKESVETDEVVCEGCHVRNPGRAEKINADKEENLFHRDTAGLKRAYHVLCMGCHREMGVANECEDCHARKD